MSADIIIRTAVAETAGGKDPGCPDCGETVIISSCGIFSPVALPRLVVISIHGSAARAANLFSEQMEPVISRDSVTHAPTGFKQI